MRIVCACVRGVYVYVLGVCVVHVVMRACVCVARLVLPDCMAFTFIAVLCGWVVIHRAPGQVVAAVRNGEWRIPTNAEVDEARTRALTSAMSAEADAAEAAAAPKGTLETFVHPCCLTCVATP